MANENSETQNKAQPQLILLSKIHDLPGVFISKPQDKALGSMVLSTQNSGVTEAVILRRRDDGEYQLLSGYRRRRASELAQKQDIPANERCQLEIRAAEHTELFGEVIGR